MSKTGKLLTMTAGAVAMYLFDPARGKRRRAMVSDKVAHLMNVSDDAADKTLRDLSNRTYGLVAEVRSRLSDDPSTLTDRRLEARVRERFGGTLSHPSAVQVSADAKTGHVTLSGDILADEVDRLLNVVSSVRAVKSVENKLKAHETPEGVPALQGEPSPRGRRRGRLDIFQEYWAPSTRLLAGTAGSILTFVGARRRGLIGTTMGTFGLGLLLRAVTNREMTRLVGVGAGRNAVSFRKTVNIDAPVEEVYAFWENVENFPRFMAHIEEVRDMGNGRSHWVASGPAGVPVEWDAEITRRVPNEELGWKSISGSVMDNAGIIRFQKVDDRRTRADITMHYSPPAGMIGHSVASLFGTDPKSAMDEDLVRMKSLLEEGKTTAEGRTVTKEEVTRELS